MECQTLSKEAYELRKSGDDASGKYKEHYATCRNQVLNEYNRVYIQGLHALAHKHKEENASLTYRAAFKHIRQELMKKAGK